MPGTHRFNQSSLPANLPVFPLPGALLLPRARLPLNIFEPRYLAMVDDALRTDHRLIGMVQPAPAPAGIESTALHQIGCAGRIVQLTETPDGRYLITLEGISRFRISAEIDSFTPYRRADLDWSSFTADLSSTIPDEGFNRPQFLALLRRFFEAKKLSSDWGTLENADEELLVNSLSIMLDFTPEDKQALLEAPDLELRRETLVTLIEFALHSGNDPDKLQ